MTIVARSDDRSRTWASLGAAVLVLVAANITRSLVVPGRWHFWFNVATGAAVFGVGALGRLSVGEIGLARSTWGAGLRLGLVIASAISAVIVLGAVLPPLGFLLDDDRTAVSAGRMWWRTLVLIPIGTVLVEELAFRGVLLGLARRLTSTVRAVAAVSVLFGLWHLLPVWRSAGGDGLASGGGAGRVAAVAGTFVATTVAGVGFSWLRLRSDSLIAPMLAHVATNSVAFAVAWAVAG